MKKAKAENKNRDTAPDLSEEDSAPFSTVEPIPLEVTDILDLHTFQPREIESVVETYLGEARGKGFPTVRIIHGKGTGTQREMVRAILSRTAFVSSYADAPPEAGGWGATLVWFASGE